MSTTLQSYIGRSGRQLEMRTYAFFRGAEICKEAVFMSMMKRCIAVAFTIATIGNGAKAQYAFNSIYHFSGDNISIGDKIVIDTDGNFYGTTVSGGASGWGSIFKLSADRQSLTTLFSFGPNSMGIGCADGLIVDTHGNLYGTTRSGGTYDVGTIFELEAGANTIKTLVSFSTPARGGFAGYMSRRGLLVDGQGNIYGTTPGDGVNSYGTLFEIAAGSQSITTLLTFNDTNGNRPNAGIIVDAAGNLYGTTLFGGSSGHGTIFKFATDTQTLTSLSFTNNATGLFPETGLVLDQQGNLYGTTSAAGTNHDGTIFKVDSGLNTITALSSFNVLNTGSGNLHLDSAGNLLGVSANNMIFELPYGSDTIVTLRRLSGGDGSDPEGGLIADSSGNFYGTTRSGSNNSGTIFKLSQVPEPSSVCLAVLSLAALIVKQSRAR